MNLLYRSNPILDKELSRRARAPSTLVALIAFLVIVGFVFCIAYLVLSVDRPYYRTTVTDHARIGSTLFEWTILLVLVAVLFFVPAISASSIVGERRRQTLIPIQLSLLKPLDIVLGKVGASSAFMMFLILATMPMLMVCYVIGGVGFFDVVGGLAVIMFTILSISTISVAVSALFKSYPMVIICSYGIVALLTWGLYLVFAIGFGVLAALAPYSSGLDDFAEFVFGILGLLNPFIILAIAASGSSSTDSYGFDGPLEEIANAYLSIDILNSIPDFVAFLVLPAIHFLFLGVFTGLCALWACIRLRLPSKRT